MTKKGKMIEAIYSASLTKRATLVIFYLINRANQELTSFPSVGTIARECNISIRTVQRALNDLEEAGFLERESRFHERGGQRSNLYKLCFLKNSDIQIKEIEFESLMSKNNQNNFIKESKERKNSSITKEKKRIDNLMVQAFEKVVSHFLHKVSQGLRQIFTP